MLKVIPIVPGTKRPLFKGWQSSAKPLEQWDLPDWPSWAAPMGPVNEQWALDVDLQHGGFLSLQAIADGRLVLHNRTDTPSGGFHTRFQWTTECVGLTNTAGVLGPGLDVRADGAYVLVPPTASYVTRFDNGLQLAPSWLMELLLAVKPRAAGAEGGVDVRAPKAYADAAVGAAVREISQAQEGQRNHTLNRNAFGLGKLLAPCGLDFDKVLELLVDTAIEAGIPAYEALDTASRGLAAGARGGQ